MSDGAPEREKRLLASLVRPAAGKGAHNECEESNSVALGQQLKCETLY